MIVDAQEAIWNATRGHPGLVKLCIDKILDKLLPIVRMDASNDDDLQDHSNSIIEYLLSHDFFITLKGTRAAVHQNFTNEVAVNLMDEEFLLIPFFL